MFFVKLGLTFSKLCFGHEIRGSHILFFIQKKRENENSANHRRVICDVVLPERMLGAKRATVSHEGHAIKISKMHSQK